MCVIIVNDKGSKINNATLLKSSVLNPDGLGVTWLDTMETEFSLSSDWSKLAVERPYIAHFRFATIGGVNMDNNHPFEIGDTKCLLYQNGSVYNLGDTTTTDTEHMASILAYLPRDEWINILEMNDCRWVVVDTKTSKFELFNECMFVENKGVQYSKSNVLDGEIIAVYGTLKRGHGNNHTIHGSKFISEGTTLNKYGMVSSGIPFVYPKAGVGFNIKVELFLVNSSQLSRADRLEGHPTNYTRRKTPIKLPDGRIVVAWLYFYDHERFNTDEDDYISEYVKERSLSLYGWSGNTYQTAQKGLVCDDCGGRNTEVEDMSNDSVWCYDCLNYVASVEFIKEDAGALF